MSDKKGLTLGQKMANILGEVDAIPKNGTNTFNNYKYVKESDLTDSLRKILAKNGVYYVWTTESVEYKDIKTKKGEDALACQCRVKYTVINSDDPTDRFDSIAFGFAHDNQDKGLYKALTGAHKYFLFRAFCVGGDDDVEKDSHEIGPRAPSMPAMDRMTPVQPQLPMSSGPRPDWASFKYKYRLPKTHPKVDLAKIKAAMKELKFKFRGNTNKDGSPNGDDGADFSWYGNHYIEEIKEFCKSVNGEPIVVVDDIPAGFGDDLNI